MYLQDINPAGAVKHQEMAVALAAAEQVLGGRGASRVHGGGFAGTIQAFVPLDTAAIFKSQMEAMLGEGSCHVLSIRPEGGTVFGIVERRGEREKWNGTKPLPGW